MLLGPEGLSRSCEKENYEALVFRCQAAPVQRKFEPFAVFRLCAGVLLVVSEIIVLGISVDTGDFTAGTAWWAPLVDFSPQLLQILIAAATAVAFWRMAGAGADHRMLTTVVSPNAFTSFVIANLFAFTFFCLLARAIFAANYSDAFSQQVLFVTWLAMGLLTALTLALSVFPLTCWKSVLLEGRWVLLGATLTGTLAWFVGEMSNQIWVSLGSGTFSLVRILLSFAYDDLVVDPSQLTLGTSRFKVAIAPSCSGYEGLGLVAVFLAVFCFVFRQRLRFPQVLILFPIGFVVVWLLNSVRIAMLIAIGTSWSSEIALGGFHSQAGWLVFNCVALGLVLIGTRVQYFVRDGNESRLSNVNLTACFLTPFLASIFVGMVIASISVDSDVAAIQAFCRIVSTVAILFLMREGLRRVCWTFSWESVAMGAAVYCFWVLMVNSESTSKAEDLTANGPTILSIIMLLRFGSYVIVTPIIEELAFRGFLMRRIVSEEFENAQLRPFPFLGVAISSLLFGVFHGQNWIPGVVGGIVFALAFVRTGHLGDSVASHATTNGLLAVHAIITRDWAVWS